MNAAIDWSTLLKIGRKLAGNVHFKLRVVKCHAIYVVINSSTAEHGKVALHPHRRRSLPGKKNLLSMDQLYIAVQ